MKEFLSEIGIVRILRYGYGGMLLVLIVAAIELEAVKTIVDVLGTIFALSITLAVGAGIYIFHRYVVGDIFLYPALHFIHQSWDKKRQLSANNLTNTVSYLEARGVKKGNGIAAYFDMRRKFFKLEERKELNIAHSELHMLWITVDETLIATIYLWATGYQPVVLFVISIILALFTTIAEIHQNQLECRLFKIAHRDGRLRPFLRKMDYLKSQK